MLTELEPLQVEIAIDTGGTFTDLVCREASGRVHHAKIPSTPDDPTRAIVAAIKHAQRHWRVHPERIVRFVHGTTVATNAVLERKGAVTGLITTRGFRDVLELGRFNRKDDELYTAAPTLNTPVFLAPRHRRVEVSERVSSTGDVVIPIDIAEVESAADTLVNAGATSIAICFLFSFLHPEHEQVAAEIVRKHYPELAVSISSFVDPAHREYERTAITCFDAYVKPTLINYLRDTEKALRDLGIACGLQVIHSRGGITEAATACERPIRLFLSGPAGGVIGGLAASSKAEVANAITLDIGGTSTDIALISKGIPLTTPLGWIDGFAVRVPMVDVNSIGAGGGSIAWLDRAGGLHVGPGSAGADPGPACYGRGGIKPTVTDASVVLGYLEPQTFAGGQIKLDVESAHRAIEREIAQPMGLTVIEAALGIHRVVNAHMAEGIRFVSVKRGHDPRRFSLVPLGGGGGIHAIPVARALGISSVLLPQLPGVLSALGMLAAPIEYERSVALPVALNEATPEELQSVLKKLDVECNQLMARQPQQGLKQQVMHYADVCYEGQSHHLEVQLRTRSADPRKVLAQDFHEAHRQHYGHASNRAIRIVNLRAVHQATYPEPPQFSSAATAAPARPGVSAIVLEGSTSSIQAAVIDRGTLAEGQRFEGPAILHQTDTTTVIEPGWQGRVLAGGLIRLEAM